MCSAEAAARSTPPQEMASEHCGAARTGTEPRSRPARPITRPSAVDGAAAQPEPEPTPARPPSPPDSRLPRSAASRSAPRRLSLYSPSSSAATPTPERYTSVATRPPTACRSPTDGSPRRPTAERTAQPEPHCSSLGAAVSTCLPLPHLRQRMAVSFSSSVYPVVQLVEHGTPGGESPVNTLNFVNFHNNPESHDQTIAPVAVRACATSSA